MAFIVSSQRFSFAAVLVCLACSSVHGKSLVPDEDSYSLARKPVRYDDLMLGDQPTQLVPRNQQGQCDPQENPRDRDLEVTSPLRNGEAVETHALLSYEGAEEKGDRMLSFGGNVEQFKSDLNESVEMNCTTYVHGVLSEADWNDTLTDLLVNMSIIKWNEAEKGYTDSLHFLDANTDDETGQLENREPKIYFVNKRWMSSVLVKWTKPSEREVVGEYLCEFHLHNEADGQSHPHKLTASIKPENKADVTTVAPTFAPTTKQNCDHVDTEIDQLEQKKVGLENLLELYRDDKLDMSYMDPEHVSNRAYFILHKEEPSQNEAMSACKRKGGWLANTTCDEIKEMSSKLPKLDVYAWIGWKWLNQNGPKWVDFSGNTANTSSCQWEVEGSEDKNCSVFEFSGSAAYANECNSSLRPLCVKNLWSN